MVLNVLIGAVYSLVQNSWIVSTVILKYLLFFTGVNVYIRDGLDLQSFEDVLLNNSRELVTLIVLIGGLNSLIGLEITPFFQIFSQLVALFFFGLLFWKY